MQYSNILQISSVFKLWSQFVRFKVKLNYQKSSFIFWVFVCLNHDLWSLGFSQTFNSHFLSFDFFKVLIVIC
jgi:hypothetical protein